MARKAIVHVVDDDPAIRDSMRLLLSSMDMEVVCYATAHEFLDAPTTTTPGCILLDLRMPNMSGLEMQRVCNGWNQTKPVIFLSGHGDVESTVRAMHQGAAEFLTKPVSDDVLLEKVNAAIEQSKAQCSKYIRQSTLRARLDLLSPRERQVLDGVFNGNSNKEIARQLRISHKTVELHRGNMMAKMHADSLAELVRMRMQLEATDEAERATAG